MSDWYELTGPQVRSDLKDGHYMFVPYEEVGARQLEGWVIVDDFEGTHHQFAATMLMWRPEKTHGAKAQ